MRRSRAQMEVSFEERRAGGLFCQGCRYVYRSGGKPVVVLFASAISEEWKPGHSLGVETLKI